MHVKLAHPGVGLRDKKIETPSTIQGFEACPWRSDLVRNAG
jgi:hypothetical protein